MGQQIKRCPICGSVMWLSCRRCAARCPPYHLAAPGDSIVIAFEQTKRTRKPWTVLSWKRNEDKRGNQ